MRIRQDDDTQRFVKVAELQREHARFQSPIEAQGIRSDYQGDLRGKCEPPKTIV